MKDDLTKVHHLRSGMHLQPPMNLQLTARKSTIDTCSGELQNVIQAQGCFQTLRYQYRKASCKK